MLRVQYQFFRSLPPSRGFLFCRSSFVPFGRDKAYPLLILENVAMTSARSASVLRPSLSVVLSVDSPLHVRNLSVGRP